MKINEIFTSIQGEGKYTGYPVLFIRTSGCTRKCSFCDTKYHINGKNYSIEELIKIIHKSKLDIVCFTGGEPTIHFKEIKELKKHFLDKDFHIETNGDLLEKIDCKVFKNINCSPKELKTAKKCFELKKKNKNITIKVVTDLVLNKEMLKYTDYVMPLTTYNKEKDNKIMKDVWDYCIKKNKIFCARVHYLIFNKQKGI